MTLYNANVTCWGKVAYDSVREAQRSMKRQYRHKVPVKLDRLIGKTTLYRCVICHQWHVGGGKERD